MTENKVHVFENNKVSSKYSHICDIKSTSLDGFNTPKNVSIKLTVKESKWPYNKNSSSSY